MFEAIAVVMLAMAAGGLLAYLGNQFGRQVGRRKISFLGLRPRYTSLLITFLVGMFTSFFAIMVVALFSEKAKTALIGLTDLQKGKKQLQREIDELNKDRNRNAALFQLNEPVAMTVVPADASMSEKEFQLKKLVKEATEEVQKRNDGQALFIRHGLMPREKARDFVTYDTQEYDRFLDDVQASRESLVFLASSERSVYFEEKMKVRFTACPNRMLFKKGETLLSVNIKGSSEEERIFFELMDFLKHLEQKGERKGMIRVPGTRSLIDIPLSDVLAAARSIRAHGGWVEVSAYATGDLYTGGPISCKLRLKM